MILISIIIPVFNVEKYLEICLESILCQNIKEYEMILVDDGSTDKSGEICDKYEKMHQHISVIHKKNGGLSDARNMGLERAKGKYILFVDSDDYIGENTLVALIEKVMREEADVIFLEAIKFFPNGTQVAMADGYNELFIEGRDKDTVMKHLSSLPKFPGSACTKLISRDLIIENNLYFQTGLLSEDIDWTIRLLKVAQKFGYLPIPYYFYRQERPGSITYSTNLRNVNCLLSIIEKWAKKELKEDFQKEINSFMAYEYMVLLYNVSRLNHIDKKAVIPNVERFQWVLGYSRQKRGKLIKYLCNIFGIRMVCILLRIYRKKV